MGQTLINLYACEHCKKQLFEKRIDMGHACSCGSRRIRRLAPSFARVVWFLLNNLKYIKVWFEENVRKDN